MPRRLQAPSDPGVAIQCICHPERLLHAAQLDCLAGRCLPPLAGQTAKQLLQAPLRSRFLPLLVAWIGEARFASRTAAVVSLLLHVSIRPGSMLRSTKIS